MDLTLVRHYFGEGATVGSLTTGTYSCYTLEDVVREKPLTPVAQWKVVGETAIPVGRYKIIIDFSNHFQQLMMHVLDVPGFEGIRIHSGNTDKDTEGCILVGYNWDGDGDDIQNSRVALHALQMLVNSALNHNEEVWITIK